MTETLTLGTAHAARFLFRAVRANDGIACLSSGDDHLGAGVDWNRVVELSNRNGVTSYVFDALSSTIGRDQRAEGVWQLLRGRALQVARRSLRLRADLLRILRCLNQAGIDAIALKGPLLADRYYSKPSLREFGDLDILVHPDDRDRAWEVLESLGYYTPYKNINLGQRYHIVFHQLETNEVVELHWRIAGPQFGVYHQGDFLWQQAHEVQYFGVAVKVPSHEAQLLYLAIHAYKHNWSRLQWMIDFREVLKGDVVVDWDRLDELARRFGAQILLRATLQLAALLFTDIVVPPKGHPLEVPVLGSLAVRQVGRGMVWEGNSWRELTNLFLIRLNAAESLSVRMRLVRAVIAPSERDEEVIALPPALRPLYFFVRPVRVLKKLFHAL